MQTLAPTHPDTKKPARGALTSAAQGAFIAWMMILPGEASANLNRAPDAKRPAEVTPAPPASPFQIGAIRPTGTALRLCHAILVRANPAKDETVSDAPEEISLFFNDAVGEQFLALSVVDAAGKRVDNHDARLDFTDHSHLRASLENLAPGHYMVRYRVLSADGHVVSGKYFFDVKPR